MAGGCLGGIVLGGILATVGVLFDAAGPVVATAWTGVGVVLVSLGFVGLLIPRAKSWLPERRCLLPVTALLAKRRTRMAFDWGFELGLGFRTLSVTPALLVIFGAIALVGGPQAIAVGGIYGAVRAATIAVFALVFSRPKLRSQGKKASHAIHRYTAVPVFAASLLAATLVGIQVISEIEG